MLIFLFVLVTTGILMFFGWCAARGGISYRSVRVMMFPATFFLSQVMGTMTFICVGWILALCLGNTDMANYVVGKASELSLASSAFGDPLTIPVWHIVVFQFFIWLFWMRPVGRMITTSVYDAGIITAAYDDKNVHPYYLRQEVIKNDSGYAASYAHYIVVGPPLLGLALVAMSRCPVNEYYN